MAKQVASDGPGWNPLVKLKIFWQEVRVEMIKVTWPTQEEVKSSTTIVLMLLVLLALTIGFYDKVFEFVIMQLLKLG